MSSSHIKVGNRIEISFIRDGKKSKSYISLVEDVYDDTHVLACVPISYGNLVKLPFSLKYSMIFYTDKGMYKYEAEILKYVNIENFNFMVVKLLSEGERTQRREFFRFSCLLPFKFEKLSNGKDEDEKDEIVLSKGIIKDIGGGGIRFVSNEELFIGDKIKCLIVLDNNYIIVVGSILHKQFYPKTSYSFQYRVEFINIKESDKDLIIKYIFEAQRRAVRMIGSMARNR